jgi:phosphatidylglycerophosphatase A
MTETDDKVTANRVLKDPVLLLAFGMGSGLMPRAPGTAGTLAAIPLYLWFSQYPWPVYLLLVLAVSVSGLWICQQASARLGVHDHPGIVWDEVAGFLVTMIPATSSWIWVVAGFLLFRLFDIWKPWPISWADRTLRGGLGIMLDDLLAGAMAAGVLAIVIGLVG